MKDYKTVEPVEQFDNMACWAASIEWWRAYMHPKYEFKTQFDIAGNQQIKSLIYYSKDEEDIRSGGFNPKHSELIFHVEGMKSENLSMGELTTNKLNRLLDKGPVVIVFNDYLFPQDYHANVIIERREICGTSFYIVMEPRSKTFEYRFINWYQRAGCYIGYSNN